MNKRKIDAYLPAAMDAICNNERIIYCEKKNEEVKKIKKACRSHISAFGGAVTMGSFKASVALFCKKSQTEDLRPELMRVLWYLTKNEWVEAEKVCKNVLAIKDSAELFALKEEFLNASVAVKLALNAFTLV